MIISNGLAYSKQSADRCLHFLFPKEAVIFMQKIFPGQESMLLPAIVK